MICHANCMNYLIFTTLLAWGNCAVYLFKFTLAFVKFTQVKVLSHYFSDFWNLKDIIGLESEVLSNIFHLSFLLAPFLG